jgi:deoxyhypusine synthase
VKFPPIDPSRAVTYPLGQRKSKVAPDMLGTPWKAGGSLRDFFAMLPRTLAAVDLRDIVERIVAAVKGQRPVILGMGAHPLKVGLSPLLIDLLEQGIVSAVAMNGAGIVHDFELAYQGETSEDVSHALGDGSFGMARETGEFLNRTIRTGVMQSRAGIGRVVGEKILADKLPYAHLSILATCARLDVPACVHVAIGTDIIHMHPQADGATIGEGSLRDFHLLTAIVARLEGGVFINLGSAVIIPEVFLKALSLARNLGHVVNTFTTVDLDFIRHYRPITNVVTRPTQYGGRGFHLTGHHEIMFPLLCAAILEELVVLPS